MSASTLLLGSQALPCLLPGSTCLTALQVEAHAEIVSRAEHEAARVAEERQQLAGRAAELAARVRALQPPHLLLRSSYVLAGSTYCHTARPTAQLR